MAENTNPTEEIIEELPEGVNVGGIGDIHPEDGDNVNVPLMENGKPCPEDPEKHDNPDCPDAGTEDDDSYEEDWDWDDDDDDGGDEEGSSDLDDDEVAESDRRDRFYEFASNSAALFNALSSILSTENLQKLSFGVNSGDLGAYFSIELKRP